MGEWGEIAAGSKRAVLGDNWRDAGVEDVDHCLRDEWAGAAVAERECARPEKHHGAHHFVFDRVTHARSVRPDEGDLESSAAVGWDGDGGECAEAS